MIFFQRIGNLDTTGGRTSNGLEMTFQTIVTRQNNIEMNKQLKAQQIRLMQQNMKNTPFFEMLQLNPNLALQSAEDMKCKVLLATLGILNDFTRDVTPNTSTLATDAHPTHWIFATCHTGNTPTMENGYTIACLPKRSCSREQFHDFVKEMVEKICGPGREEGTICRPDDWRTKN